MFGTLDDFVKDMKHGTYDLTENGKCTGCGECCSNLLPITDAEIRKIKAYMKRNNIKQQKHGVAPLRAGFDLKCPFLDESKEKKCTIYPVRPKVCQDFICNPKQRSKPDFTRNPYPVDMRATFFGEKNILEIIGKEII